MKYSELPKEYQYLANIREYEQFSKFSKSQKSQHFTKRTDLLSTRFLFRNSLEGFLFWYHVEMYSDIGVLEEPHQYTPNNKPEKLKNYLEKFKNKVVIYKIK